MYDKPRQPSSPNGGRNPFLASVLDQLACPACYGHLRLDEHQLRCEVCGRIYPILDGIPVLIAENIEPPPGEP